jgi:aminoglycoside phosphotransferase (APT) family kinase protein
VQLTGINALVQKLAPDGKLTSMRRLRGGLGGQTHVLTIARVDGSQLKAVLRRRRIDEDNDDPPGTVSAEWDCLRLVRNLGIPAPEPLLLDASGEYFGVPAIVLAYVPGGLRLQAGRSPDWAEQFALVLARIHSVTPKAHDLSHMPRYSKNEIREAITTFAERPVPEDKVLLENIRETLLANIEHIEWPEPCLLHGDFWPGNTVWNRGRLAAVIDWSEARVGDRRSDIAQCQMELSFTMDLQVGDDFVHAYERITGPQPQFWFFELYRAMTALAFVRRWLPGYNQMGIRVAEHEAMEKLRAYIRRALASEEGFERGCITQP